MWSIKFALFVPLITIVQRGTITNVLALTVSYKGIVIHVITNYTYVSCTNYVILIEAKGVLIHRMI